MELATFHSAWTLILLVTFIGIILWAWSGRRRSDFDDAARIPLEDDDGCSPDEDQISGRRG